jgi:hypothetical protein
MTFGWVILLPDNRQLAHCSGPAFGQLIQVDTDNMVHSLTTKPVNMDIDALEGENVMRACSLIHGIYDHIVWNSSIDRVLGFQQTTNPHDFLPHTKQKGSYN